MIVDVAIEPVQQFSLNFPILQNSSPSSVAVQCLNCSVQSKVEASQPDGKLFFLCEDCRENLKQNPQPIRGYHMIRQLGKGGMGNVMLARSEKDGRAVAIKTLLPEVAVSEKSLKRFMREIEVSATLRHPHIVSYIEHGSYNGTIYLVSEFVSGMDASKLVLKSRLYRFHREYLIFLLKLPL